MELYCKKCGRNKDEKHFYTSNDIEKYPPNGKLDECKMCFTMHVDPYDPQTFLDKLEQIDVPYVEKVWNDTITKHQAKYGDKKVTGSAIFGKYLSSMKLVQYKEARWKDSEKLNNQIREELINSMRVRGYSGEDIEKELSKDRAPQRPKIEVDDPSPQLETPEFDFSFDEELASQLTDEDKRAMRLKWGNGYRASEWVRLEQLYNDMMDSYDIQGAGTKDTLIMICKASLKANQAIDCADLEGFQKMTKVYKDLMTSAKLTAAQLKATDEDEIDSIGALVAICEKEGFIPRYYVTTPNDKVDSTIKDMQEYTRTLVMEELNLGNMIEKALKEIEADKAREATIQTDDEEETIDELEASLFTEEHEKTVEEDIEDYAEFQNWEEALRAVDENGIS